MKNLSKISVFLFIICVFGDDGHRVVRVSVNDGDSVTLDTGLTEKFTRILWWFGDLHAFTVEAFGSDLTEEFNLEKLRFGDSDSIIAEIDGNEISYTDDERFRDRLELNHQTGSLTINNMTMSDTAVYHLQIDQNSGTLLKTFIVTVHVFGADEHEVKRVSVMEGDSVTLDTRLREKFNHIDWIFGDIRSYAYSVIAKSDGNEISYTDERFRDRLKLNNQTGSLTINNMRITDSGLYEVEIYHGAGISTMTFMVIVCGSFYPVPGLSPGAKAGIVVVILLLVLYIAAVLYYHHNISKRRRQNHEEKTEFAKEGESVALRTDAEIQTDEEKLELDHQTRSRKTTDSGDYKLQINPCSKGSRGKNAHESETSETPLLSEEDPDRARVQYVKVHPQVHDQNI